MKGGNKDEDVEANGFNICVGVYGGWTVVGSPFR